ncbi:MAG: hypothetical protein ABI585_01325 [Betaproteobacteria bacterium]
MTNHPLGTDAARRRGVRAGFGLSPATGTTATTISRTRPCADRFGINDHDRPTGPETMR